jgi:hypothetical protein
MRLLNTTTGELEEFFESNRPPYAILSHTWGSDEVTFKQLQEPNIRHRAGYRKVRHTLAQALKDGLTHVWIDTCCIDKSSSAELTEAINSMFAWYRDATVCYAFLEDVESLDEGILEASRWFKRSWTLQELIAPRKLLFFGRDFACLAKRSDLSERIEAITSIPSLVITGSSSPRTYSVAQRMSWASNRRATRREDVAYSLMGIFAVNMPLLYGEGERAFVRLQKEIWLSEEDQTLFAWAGLDKYEAYAEIKYNRDCFATSPLQFRHAASIVPLSTRVKTEPSVLTSRGVRLQAPLIQSLVYSNSYLAVLACQDTTKLGKRLGIALHSRPEERFADHFGRVNYLHNWDANEEFKNAHVYLGDLCVLDCTVDDLEVKTFHMESGHVDLELNGYLQQTAKFLVSDNLTTATTYNLSQVWPEHRLQSITQWWIQSAHNRLSRAAMLFESPGHPSLLIYLHAYFGYISWEDWVACAKIFQDPPPELFDELMAHFDSQETRDSDTELPDDCWYLPERQILPDDHKVEISIVRDAWDRLLWHVNISVVPMKDIIAEAVAQMFPFAW